MVGVTQLLLLASVGATVGYRRPRQASTCSPGASCRPLSSCQYFADLLQSPTDSDIIELQSAVCQYNRRDPKVCCPGSGSGTSTTTPPTRPTLGTRPTQPTPTPTTSPGAGEALLPSSCGRGAIETRIISGEDAPLGAYPWMAVLGYGSFQDPFFACGGALITGRYVITAAHCVSDKYTFGAILSVVRLGEHNLDTVQDCKRQVLVPGEDCARPVQDIAPAAIIPHPQFDQRANFSDDIALIRLEKTATLNANVQPICLARANLDVGAFVGSREAVVAGWGLTESGRHSAILQRVRLPFVDLETCKPHFRNTGIQLLEQQVCFGGQGSRDTCRGDSGGAVFSSSGGNIPYVMLGVVSFGVPGLGCGAIDVPAVYTNVASYRAWITSNMRP